MSEFAHDHEQKTRLLAEIRALEAERDRWRNKAELAADRERVLQEQLNDARTGLVAEQNARSRSEIIVLAARRLRIAVETLNGISQAETALWSALAAEDEATKMGMG